MAHDGCVIERADVLPEPRGACSAWLLDVLGQPVHALEAPPVPEDDPVTGDDAPLSLYLCYELHYRGWPGVDDAWEWEPSLLQLRRRLERDLATRVGELVGPVPDVDDVPAYLQDMLDDEADPGNSIARWLAEKGTLRQAREAAVLRSVYQLKEADPHTFAIPRLAGEPKAALVEIQKDEYGEGREADVHAELFAETMRMMGLDSRYHAYIDHVPGTSLAGVNLVSWFGLHRSNLGALIGHLAAFEMASVAVMADLSLALRNLGFDSWTRLFYDTHVVADAAHQRVAADHLAGGFIRHHPDRRRDVLFGALALAAVEARATEHVLGAWSGGRSALRRALPPATEMPGLGPPPPPGEDPRRAA